MLHDEHPEDDRPAEGLGPREDGERPVGAEGGEKSARRGAPFSGHPEDDTPLWDTDQHSRTAKERTDPGDDQGMRGG